MKPKLFISHSASKDPYAAAVLDELTELMKRKNYDVLVDRERLRAGERWAACIYQWLGECDAAVVLLNRRAVEASPWVQREVNILLWRQALGSPVYIVPALLGDLTSKDVDMGFSELKPLEFSRVDGPDPAELARHIADRFAEVPTAAVSCDPMREWIERIETYLREVKDEDPLVDSARALGVPEPDLEQVRLVGGRMFLAHQFLAGDLGPRTVQALSKLTTRIPYGDPRRYLVKEVIPVWVDGAQARRLLPGRSRPHRLVILLNAVKQETAVDYLHRATCLAATGYDFVQVTSVAGEDPVTELTAAYERAVEDMLGGDLAAYGMTLETVPWDEIGSHLFLIVDPGRAPMKAVAQAVRNLHDRAPRVVVVLLTGRRLPDEQAVRALGLADAARVDTGLEGDAEFLGRTYVNQLIALVKGK
ncbi:toll/interleukin-1 receptor domain-containing protein [Thermoactinospora rubra]|uniref:toll/interleukin-1 receptor domain-containing protein n=1 Tax=Thermoactinospora rubra TaxID=1088767 RepID=UPI001301FE45|nr:toll/interleukin-1 receptor domain-containing protein [Thermoactinospora rubra]